MTTEWASIKSINYSLLIKYLLQYFLCFGMAQGLFLTFSIMQMQVMFEE